MIDNLQTNLIFYVYQYLNEDGTPYYIGKGKNNRINEKHKHTMTPSEQFRQIIASGLSETDALALENQLIRLYKRKIDGGILDNIKINQWAGTSGWTHKPETKKKISDSTIGKPKSEEHKAKMRKPKSEAHKQKIREANLGRKDDGRALKAAITRKRNSSQRKLNDLA